MRKEIAAKRLKNKLNLIEKKEGLKLELFKYIKKTYETVKDFTVSDNACKIAIDSINDAKQEIKQIESDIRNLHKTIKEYKSKYDL